MLIRILHVATTSTGVQRQDVYLRNNMLSAMQLIAEKLGERTMGHGFLDIFDVREESVT